MYVGTAFEGVATLFLVLAWVVGIAGISNVENELAVSAEGNVVNGNLYYFGWAASIGSVVLFMNFIQGRFGLDLMDEFKHRSKRITEWSILMALSLVVLGASADIYKNVCNENITETKSYCSRTAYAISIGTLGTVLSLLIVALKIGQGKSPFLWEALISGVLFILFVFGAMFITAGHGPGAPLGNLYYSTWGAFVTSMVLCKSCYEDYLAARGVDEEERQRNDGIPVEQIGDDQI